MNEEAIFFSRGGAKRKKKMKQIPNGERKMLAISVEIGGVAAKTS